MTSSRISIIVPVYNEGENIRAVYDAVRSISPNALPLFELIFIDDGSTDQSAEILKRLGEHDERIMVVTMARNFGQTAALAAGITYAHGDIIVTMDGDMQNDPRDIPSLIVKLNEGYDVVSGWRKERKDSFVTRFVPSWCANKLISFVTGVRLRDYGCTLKAYRKGAFAGLELYGEMHRFIPALAAWNGARIAEIPVQHHARVHGRSHYGMGRIARVFLDLVVVKFLLSFRTRPIQFFGPVGLGAIFLGMALFALVVWMKIVRSTDMTGNPFFLFAFISILLGVQFIVLGLLAEILSRVYYSNQDRKTYVVKEVLKHE